MFGLFKKKPTQEHSQEVKEDFQEPVNLILQAMDDRPTTFRVYQKREETEDHITITETVVDTITKLKAVSQRVYRKERVLHEMQGTIYNLREERYNRTTKLPFPMSTYELSALKLKLSRIREARKESIQQRKRDRVTKLYQRNTNE